MFPRLFAFAETVWSPRDGKDFADFQKRLAPQLARLDKEGVTYWSDPFAGAREIGGFAKPAPEQGAFPVTAQLPADLTAGRLDITLRADSGAGRILVRSVSLVRDGATVATKPVALRLGTAVMEIHRATGVLELPEGKGNWSVRFDCAALDGDALSGKILVKNGQ
jgi:hypothetical protein